MNIFASTINELLKLLRIQCERCTHCICIDDYDIKCGDEPKKAFCSHFHRMLNLSRIESISFFVRPSFHSHAFCEP